MDGLSSNQYVLAPQETVAPQGKVSLVQEPSSITVLKIILNRYHVSVRNYMLVGGGKEAELRSFLPTHQH